MDSTALGRVLIVAGLAVAGVGTFLALGGTLPLGRLPGDITVRSGTSTFSFPIVSCIVASLLLTIVLSIVLRR
ncbi:MAG: DUF2905 domain-containing protein [Candidatus Dormibacteria bacterium]